MNDEIKSDALAIKLQTSKPIKDKLEFVVNLKNSASRALHYISDVRALRFDPTSKTLTISLTDEGREIIPGTVSKLPNFQFIDPNSEAEIHLNIPNKIVKLSRNAPPGEIAFETQALDNIDQLVIDIAWSDTPYYEDTREQRKSDTALPSVRWQQHKAELNKKFKSEPRKKS